MDRYQSTINQKIRMTGTGLHSGRDVTLEMLPAVANHGIVFQRTDLERAAPIAANVANIHSTELSTRIGEGQNSVSTIEHLMAALVGLGIDNVLIRLDGPEVPIMDGSSAPFVSRLTAAGQKRVDGYRKLLLMKKPFEVRDGDKLMRIEPADRLSFHCAIDFRSAAIGRQELDFTFNRSSFLDLCDARTFCHVNEVNAMRAVGLALGGSLANAVVVNDDSVMNDEGLRTDDEFVRHKLLDCIGDLALMGAPLIGRITLQRAGHGLHAQFMKELLRRKGELLTVVEIGPFRDKKPAMVDGLSVIAAASALYG